VDEWIGGFLNNGRTLSARLSTHPKIHPSNHPFSSLSSALIGFAEMFSGYTHFNWHHLGCSEEA